MENTPDYGKLNDILTEMGAIGHRMFPKVSETFFTKKFATGIKIALKVHKCKDWNDAEQKDINTRKRIIRGIMNGAQQLFLDAGMFDPEIDRLYNKIDHELENLVS